MSSLSHDVTFTSLQDTGTASDTDVWAAPGAGKSIYLYMLMVTGAVAGTLTVTAGADASGTRIIDVNNAAGGGAMLEWNRDQPLKVGDNTALKLTSTGTDIDARVVAHGFVA